MEINQDLIYIIILFVTQIITSIIVGKKNESTIKKSIRRMESTTNTSGSGTLAHEIYTLVESINNKITSAILPGKEDDIDTDIGKEENRDGTFTREDSIPTKKIHNRNKKL